MKDGNLTEDTIQKTEILMNSARRFVFAVILGFWLMWPAASKAQQQDLTGPVTKEEILANDRIYKIYIDRYEPDREAVEYLSAYRDSVQLMVFVGSWCRESRKYIPGLMKTLEVVGSDNIDIRYIAVDHQKKLPKSFLNKFDIKYIPSVLVLKGTTEVGRIEEKPHRLIETDLVQILDAGNEKKE
ncbi:thioredoxin family protein [Gracilimonas sp.]|uniref:thioredoxin family protein n=1 Tax=Gracilimonas sp. TaxID=1974203 RepID=UPI003D0C0FE4